MIFEIHEQSLQLFGSFKYFSTNFLSLFSKRKSCIRFTLSYFMFLMHFINTIDFCMLIFCPETLLHSLSNYTIYFSLSKLIIIVPANNDSLILPLENLYLWYLLSFRLPAKNSCSVLNGNGNSTYSHLILFLKWKPNFEVICYRATDNYYNILAISSHVYQYFL